MAPNQPLERHDNARRHRLVNTTPLLGLEAASFKRAGSGTPDAIGVLAAPGRLELCGAIDDPTAGAKLPHEFWDPQAIYEPANAGKMRSSSRRKWASKWRAKVSGRGYGRSDLSPSAGIPADDLRGEDQIGERAPALDVLAGQGFEFSIEPRVPASQSRSDRLLLVSGMERKRLGA